MLLRSLENCALFAQLSSRQTTAAIDQLGGFSSYGLEVTQDLQHRGYRG